MVGYGLYSRQNVLARFRVTRYFGGVGYNGAVKIGQTMSVAITEAITTLVNAEQRFQLSRTESDSFFWNGVLIYQGLLMWIKQA